MRRADAGLPLVLLLAAATIAGSPAPRQDQAPTFRSSADVVSVDASVRSGRRAVIGLKPADFEILDNGVPQEVADVSYQKLPIDVTVLLDVSESITLPVLDELRRAVRQLRAGLDSRDRLKLTTFNMRIRRLVDFAGPDTASDAMLTSMSGSGSSAIFDALAVALTAASPAGRRHLIVLFSDGIDSSSITEPQVLIDVARRSAATIAVVLASPTRQLSATIYGRPVAPAMTIRQLYDQLASDTGGDLITTVAGDQLASTFGRVLDEFRASYVLHFSPRGVPRSGFHTLDVRVRRPGVDVRARRAYTWH